MKHPGSEQTVRFTPKMQAFADEWLTGAVSKRQFYAVGALKAAGYATNGKNPGQMAYKLLKHPAIKEYINKHLEAIAMSSHEIMARFSDIARCEPGDILELKQGPNGQPNVVIDPLQVVINKRYIKSFTYDSNGNPKIEFHDPVAALQQMARMRGMLKDGLELSGPGGGAVPVEMTVRFVRPDGSSPTHISETPQIAPPDEDFSEYEED